MWTAGSASVASEDVDVFSLWGSARLWKRFLVGSEEGPSNAGLAELSAPLRTNAQLERLAENQRSAADEFQFAVLGDAEPGRFWISRRLFNRPGVFERQLAAIQEEPVDFLIQLGDMVSRGTPRHYHRLLRRLSRTGLRKPYLTVIGNHDRLHPHRRSDARLYRACFGSTNYAFDYACARFVVLDTSAKRVSARQMRWLDRVLDSSRPKLVFTHIPPNPLRPWTDFAGARGLGGFQRGADELTGLFSSRGVDRVYLGHIHGFGVQDYRGVRYVLSGGGGSPLFPSGALDRFYHYIVVSVAPGGIRETVRGLDGGCFEIPAGKVLISR